MMLGVSLLSHTSNSAAPTTPTDAFRELGGSGGGLLQQCRSIEEFKQVHARLHKLGLHRTAPHAGALIRACALSEWGSVEYARKVFGSVDDPTSYEFNTMMRGYVREGSCCRRPEEAVFLYREMLEAGVAPDNYTFPFVLKACGRLGDAGVGAQVHGQVHKLGYFHTDTFVQNSLISMYGRCGQIRDSSIVFENMVGGDRRSDDAASWSSVIAAHAKAGLWGDCLKLFERMRADGRRRPDESTLVSVLSSCTNLGALDLGRCAHCSLLRNASELNVVMQTSLIDMYVKCGRLEKGVQIFKRMERKNEWAYSAMISGLAMHGEGEEALSVFSDMLEEGLSQPDEAVYVGVLSACSRSGLLAEGIRYIDRMRSDRRAERAPSALQYSCAVDLMARAGELEKARELIRTMPVEPNDSVWRSLLSGCRVHGNFDLAEVARENLFRLRGSVTAGDYVLMSNVYAQAGRPEEAARLRTEMVDRGLAQTPGFCRVEAKGEVHTFVSQDRTHPEREEIYETLHQVEWQLRFEGYVPDTSQVLPRGASEEDKRRVLGGHSQKLAVAYGLISTGRGEVMRIVRNLRMCGDCHAYTKLVSGIFDREIVVRDRNRFHRFRDGACSCGDYW